MTTDDYGDASDNVKLDVIPADPTNEQHPYPESCGFGAEDYDDYEDAQYAVEEASSPSKPLQTRLKSRASYRQLHLDHNYYAPSSAELYSGTGLGPQALRGMPGFPTQQPPQNRTTSIGSGRIQNGKLGRTSPESFGHQKITQYIETGSGSNWGFGVPMGTTPSLAHPQSRPTSTGMTSFAQTIGGSQPNTPLDLSEFPSLSGGGQQHQNPPAQAVWANSTQRTTQHTPSQRVQPPPPSNPSSHSQQQQQQTSSQPSQSSSQRQDDGFPSSSQFAQGLDDYRYGGQGAIGQQPQTTNIEEFPPLGRNENGDIGQDRRAAVNQHSPFTNGTDFNSALLRQSIQNRSTSGSNALSSRSPVDIRNQGQNGLADQDKNLPLRSSSSSTVNNSMFSYPQPSAQAGLSQSGAKLGFGNDVPDPPPPTQTPDNMSISQMNELDKFGLPGLLRMIRHENADLASLALGQDLTTLGLDLNQPDNNPLYQTFAGPFAEAGSRPVEPEFSVPACYTVQNVHPLASKIPSFADETLFYIFYTMPRDIMQEIVAQELSNRNWRFHKDQKQWLTKDNSFEPIRISENEERGYYIFFDPNTWQKTRREFLLQYSSLDSRSIGPVPLTGLSDR